MDEKEKELLFMVTLYKRARNRGYYGTFCNFLDEIFYPIKNYPEEYVDPFHEILETFKLGVEVARKETGGCKSEIDLKIEEMRTREKFEELQQNREIEMKKIELEEKKWEYDKQRDADLSKQIEEILKSLADKVRGLKPVQILCPNEACRKLFYTDGYDSFVVCPHCGKTLEKTSASPPPQPQPPAEPTQTKQP